MSAPLWTTGATRAHVTSVTWPRASRPARASRSAGRPDACFGQHLLRGVAAPALRLLRSVTRTSAIAIGALVALPALANAQGAQQEYRWWGPHAEVRTLLMPEFTVLPPGRWGNPACRDATLGQAPRGFWHTSPLSFVPPRPTWPAADLALAGAFGVALWVDAAQTRELARQGWKGYREANPILGPRPTIGQINRYTAVAGLTVLGLAAAVPARWRRWLLASALAVETFTVAGTVREGIALRLR